MVHCGGVFLSTIIVYVSFWLAHSPLPPPFARQCTALVDANTPIQTGEFSSAEVDCIRDFGCITTKPQIYVVNLSQKNFIRKGSKWLPKIKEWVDSHGGGLILPVSCEFEQKLYDLKDDKEAQKGKFVDW